MRNRTLHLFGLLGLSGLAACGAETQDTGLAAPRALTGACVDDASQIPAGALTCGGAINLECGVASSQRFFVTAAELGQSSCGMTEVRTSVLSLGVGTERVVASAVTPTGLSPVCTATVTVRDTTPPAVSGRTIQAWPPNHRWLEVTPADCASVADSCGATTFRFTHAEVDEPENGRGDGNFAPDIELSCDLARVRSERAGGADGRIYRLHFEVEDDAGLVTTGSCDVEVAHDQASPAVWSGPSYAVASQGGTCGPTTSSPGTCTAPVPYDDSLNTGPLPAECTKIEGGDIGREGVEVGFSTETATLTGWRTKSRGEYIGFDIAVTSTPAWVSVKAGPEVFGEVVSSTQGSGWRHPGGTSGPSAKGISNIVICKLPCNPPSGGGGGGGGGGDAGVPPDTGSAPDMGGAPDAGASPDLGGSPDMGGAPDAGSSPVDMGIPDTGTGF